MHSLLRDIPRLARYLALAAVPMTLHAQPARSGAPDIRLDIPAIEQYIARQMQRNRIPGVAIAIVSNDSVIYAQGFGTDGFGNPVTERPTPAF